ncbi:MAG: sulfotransferase family 2 domain-containing protein [Bacteroidota bacterium]
MIISHRHQFIFFAIPKTGTHAFRFALREHLGEMDQEQVGLYVKKSLPYPELSKLGHGHISCEQAKAVLDPEIWENYFKFAIVRNPWDRFVSFCFYMNRKNRRFAKNPLPAMKAILANPAIQNRILFRPQHEFICDKNGKQMVDWIGRYEELQTAYDTICEQLNFPKRELEHLNATVRKSHDHYFDESLKAAVQEYYQKDIKIFNYSF